MKSSVIPYHLRPNKSVERNIFLNLLSMINGYNAIDIKECVYIGFGGPFLEDFKNIHARFGTRDMYSLESDPMIFERQKFNSPLKCIEMTNFTSREFIDGYSITKNAIIWLDYTSAEDIFDQFVDFKTILERTVENDVIKVTLNANPRTLGTPHSDELMGLTSLEQEEAVRKYRLKILRERLSDFFYPATKPEMMTDKKMAEVLVKSLKIAVDAGLMLKRAYIFQPLCLFSYADSGNTMLTATGIILKNDKKATEDFLLKTGIGNWPLARTNWESPIRIDVPDLTVKERVHLDSMLPPNEPADLDVICKSVAFIKRSQIENYVDYYRFYPYFSKILL